MRKQTNSNIDLINKKNNKVNNKSSQEIQEILRNLANQTPRLTEDQLIILQKEHYEGVKKYESKKKTGNHKTKLKITRI